MSDLLRCKVQDGHRWVVNNQHVLRVETTKKVQRMTQLQTYAVRQTASQTDIFSHLSLNNSPSQGLVSNSPSELSATKTIICFPFLSLTGLWSKTFVGWNALLFMPIIISANGCGAQSEGSFMEARTVNQTHRQVAFHEQVGCCLWLQWHLTVIFHKFSDC